MGGSISATAKQIFLRHYRDNKDSLLSPVEQENNHQWRELLSEINCQVPGTGANTDTSCWKDMLLEWTSEVRLKFKSSLDNEEMVYFSSEDFQLLGIDCVDNELSLLSIVKYVEEDGCLKGLLDRIQSTDTTLHEWEVELMGHLKRLVHKKKLFDFNRHHLILEHQHLMKDFFTALELKLLALISDSEDHKSLVAEHRFQIEICRVCCHHKPNGMLNIFSCSLADGLSFAAKIGICVDVPIEEQDTLPKSICRDCAQNLETCYEFQKLCKESDYELRRDKKLRDMIMEQVLDKTMGCSVDSSGWSSNSTSDILKALDGSDKGQWNSTGEENENNGTAVVGEDDAGDGGGIIEAVNDLTPISSHPSPSSSTLADENCDIRKFQCELCGARFFDVYNFKTHWRIHKIVKKYECQAQGCGKKFRTNVMLKIHLRTHTGERPYSCQTCLKKFKTASAVTSHQAVHATVKAFKCDLCPYEGTTKPNLRIHQRTHSKEQPYVCQQCGKRFSTASNLLKHSRNIHQRLKTNKCPVCEKRFFSRESCRKHLITHTDSKPYDCRHCPAVVAYSWYSGLEKHYQKHHKRFRMPAESSFKTRVEKALSGGAILWENREPESV